MRYIFLTLIILLTTGAFSKEKKDKIPWKVRRSVPELTDHLTDGITSPTDKAEAIYAWVTENIAYNYDVLMSDDYFIGQNPTSILRSKKAISSGFAELTRAMLTHAGIESETISGYVHDVAWQPGQLVTEDTHEWIALKLDGKWYLADPAWDSGYIGRLPIKRKPYTPKKYLIKKFKNPKRHEDIMAAREKREEERKEAYENKPKYKKEVGFVRESTRDFFLIESDSFLLNHLPVNPVWQLRPDYISLEDFALSEDSLRLRLEENGGHNLDFEAGIERLRSNTFLDQYLINGEEGYAYNQHNPGIKLFNYYNFMALINNRNLQKLARGSIYAITPDKFPVLSGLNDTLIKYVKLFKTYEKDLYKFNRSGDKERYGVSKTRDKQNSGLIKKIGSEKDKLINYIDQNNTTIKANLKRIEESRERIIEKYPPTENYKENKYLKKEYLKPWSDSMQFQLEGLEKLQKDLDKMRENSNYMVLLGEANYVAYLLETNSDFIQFNSYSNNEIIEEIDTLIGFYGQHMVDLFSDSLRLELVQKNVNDALKQAKTYIRMSKADFKEYETAGKIENASLYEVHIQAQYLQLLAVAEEINKRGAYFNHQVIPLLKASDDLRRLEGLMEDQVKLKEEKSEYIAGHTLKAHERYAKLIEQIQEDSKGWKKEYRVKK